MPEYWSPPPPGPTGFFLLLPEAPSVLDWVAAAVRYLDRPSPQVVLPAQLVSLHGVRTVDISAALDLAVSVQHLEPPDAIRVTSLGLRIFVFVPPPSERLSPLRAMVFNLVRTTGGSPSSAVRAAGLVSEFSAPALEAYLTLLSDGTPWRRAAELAELVDPEPSAP